MKKIIRNRVYDTDKATLVGMWDNDKFVSDFDYICETLYRKRNGEYFLHGEGGPMTQYAVNVGIGNVGYGEEIRPMTYEQARFWAEHHLTAEEYARAFAVIDDNSEVVLSVRVPAASKARLDRMAARTGRSKSSILAELLDECD